MGNGYVTVPVKPATKDRLDRTGHKGEKYDDLVNRLLDQSCQKSEAR